jgi:predicted nuclease with TOPRIM domain
MDTTQIVVTIIGVLGSASIWKYLEVRLKANSESRKEIRQESDTVQFRDELKNRVQRLEQLLEESNAKVLELTAAVGRLETEVHFLTKENERLKNK